MRVRECNWGLIDAVSFAGKTNRVAFLICVVFVQLCIGDASGEASSDKTTIPLPGPCAETFERPLGARLTARGCSSNDIQSDFNEGIQKWQALVAALSACAGSPSVKDPSEYEWTYSGRVPDRPGTMPAEGGAIADSSDEESKETQQTATTNALELQFWVRYRLEKCVELLLQNNEFPGGVKPSLTSECADSEVRVGHLASISGLLNAIQDKGLNGREFASARARCTEAVGELESAAEQNKCCTRAHQAIEEMKRDWFELLGQLNKLMYFNACKSFVWKGESYDAEDVRASLLRFYSDCDSARDMAAQRCKPENCVGGNDHRIAHGGGMQPSGMGEGIGDGGLEGRYDKEEI